MGHDTSIPNQFLFMLIPPFILQVRRREEQEAGVNICPKKSETVYPEIWGILKLSVLINQKIFETVYRKILGVKNLQKQDQRSRAPTKVNSLVESVS